MRRRYEQYAEVLEKKPELHLKLESSREIASVNDLLEDGFLVASEDYISWVGAEEERSFSKGPQDEHGPSVEAFLEARRQDREKALRLGSLERGLRAYEQQGGGEVSVDKCGQTGDLHSYSPRPSPWPTISPPASASWGPH